MENIYKTLRDIGVELANINESSSLLKAAAKAAQGLIEAREVYALVLDENGSFQLIYSNAPTPQPIESLRTEIADNNCLRTAGHICVRLSTNHLIYLVTDGCSPKQNEMLELFREQTALQLRGILQHEKTAADLRDSKDSYQNLLSSLHEGIWVIDAEANTTFVNEQMAKMLGYTIEQMSGKHLYAFMDEEGVKIANNNLSRREQGVEEQHPFKFLHKKGHPVYTLMETSPIMENGSYVGAIAGVMDITERERVFKELRYSENKYRNLLGSLHEGILVVDENAHTTLANKPMAEMLGYTVEEMIGKHLFEFMDEEGIEFTKNAISRRKQGVHEQFPFKFIKKDGQPLQSLLATSPIMENGRYVGAIAGIMDITERYRIFEELRYSEKRFRDLVETTSDWIWEVDTNGVYTYSSKVITDLLGYKPEEIIGTTPFDLMMPDEAERVRDIFTGIVAKKEPFTHLWNVSKHKNGKLVPVSSAGVPIFSSNGELIGYRGIDRNITNLVKQRESRAKARQQTQLLLSVISGISEAPDFQTALEASLRLVSDHANWVYSEAWIIDSLTERLFNHAQFYPAEYQERLSSFSTLSWNTTFALDEGVPGWTWVSQETAWYENIQALPPGMYLRLDAARKVSLKAALAVPAIVNGETMAVLMFYADSVHEKESEAMQLITAVASQLGLILQQKQTQETVRKLSRAVEQSITSIFITDLDSNIEFVNPAFTEISGYSESEVLGQTPSLFRSENTPEVVYQALWTALQKGGLWEGRIENKHKGGTPIWLQSSISTIKDHLGSPTHYLCIQSDITEQVASEAALRASEARNHALIQAIPDVMFTTSRDGVILEYHGGLQKPSLSTEEFLNKNVTDLLPPDIAKQSLAAIKLALANEETQQFVFSLRVGEPTIAHYDVRFTMAGKNHVLVIMRDVTSQRQAEEALQASEEKNRGLIKAIPDIMFLLNNDGLLLANYGIEEGLLLPPEEFLNKNLKDVVPPAVYEPTFIAIEAALHTGETQQYSYALSIDNDVSTNYYDARITVVAGNQLLMIVRDVTIQRQAESALRKSERKLANAQELVHLGSWEWDILSGGISWSDETYRIFGYEPQSFETTYEKFLEMIPPEDVEGLETAVLHCLYTHEPYHIEHRIKRPSGEIRYVREQGEVVCDENGNAIRMVGAILDITQQSIAHQKIELAREAAQQSERKLAKAQELAHLGSWTRNVITEESTWSDEMYRIAGYEPQSFIMTYKLLFTMVHPDDVQKLKTAVEQSLVDGEPYALQYRIQQKSGDIRHVHGYGEPIQEDGIVTRIIGGTLDITDQVIAQQNLQRVKDDAQQNEYKLAKAQELAHLGSWARVVGSGVNTWSDEMYRIFGHKPQSFVVTPDAFLSMIHPDDVEHVKTAVRQNESEGKPYTIEYRIQLESGEIRYMRGYGEPVYENGVVAHVMGGVLDVTKQIIAQQKVEAAKEIAQQSEYKLARAQAIAHLGNWEWNEQSQLVIWSDEAYRMAGYEPQSFPITRTKFLSMLHPDDVEGEKTAVKESLISGKPYLVTYRFKRPSGEIRYIEERGEPIYTNDVLHLVGTTLDITEQSVAQQRLEQASKVAQELQIKAERANRAKSMFLTNMSHELRTPLNGILGYTQLFKQDDSLSAQQLHGIDVIHRSGEHLLFMINDMLDLAKIEAGKMTLSLQECHLPEMLSALVNMISQLAKQKGIIFSHRLATGLPQMIMTDGVRLRQILLNLLSNAVKFTNSGAVLLEVLPIQTAVFTSKPTSIKIRFRVEDTGVGIAPELLKTIFSPFEQVSTIKDNIDGTGLGLTISQRLASLLGGTLEVSSRLGEGSVFWLDLDLPIADNSKINAEHTTFTTASISGVQGDRNVRLLIVDDVDSNRLILSSYFSMLSGFTIMEADDGVDAVEKAKKFKPHLILMDLRMPRMDGLEATRQIRLLPALEKSIIIAISANAYINIKEDMLDAGFDGFFVKPIKLAQLSEQIRIFLGDEWEWLYGTEQTGKVTAETAVIIPLPKEETAVLLELAQNGDIKNLRDNLGTFKQRLDPQYYPIIEKLTQLAQQYRVKQIREQLEKQT